MIDAGDRTLMLMGVSPSRPWFEPEPDGTPTARRMRRGIVYSRIASDPAVLGGKPVIKGTRISVELLLELFASGATRHEILEAYPHLTPQDIEEALRYAAEALKHDRVIPPGEPRA